MSAAINHTRPAAPLVRPRLRRRQRKVEDHGDAIDVLVVDSDPAVRSSLQGVLSVEPGIGTVDAASSSAVAIKRVVARCPQVCLINYHLAADAGLLVTRHLKRLERSPDVIVYAVALDSTIAAASRIAGADGLIVSPPSTRELGQIIRRVADGEKQLPTITPSALTDVTVRLDPLDRPIATMLVRDTAPSEAAAVLGLSREQLSLRRWAILDRLRRPSSELAGRDATADGRHDAATTRMRRLERSWAAAVRLGHVDG